MLCDCEDVILNVKSLCYVRPLFIGFTIYLVKILQQQLAVFICFCF